MCNTPVHEEEELPIEGAVESALDCVILDNDDFEPRLDELVSLCDTYKHDCGDIICGQLCALAQENLEPRSDEAGKNNIHA